MPCESRYINYIYHLLGFPNLYNQTQGAEDELKHAVGLVRPVSVAFEVVTSFRFYKNGVYTSDVCGSTSMVSYYYYCALELEKLI